MFLPDVDVLLALLFDAHKHHPVARAWFDGVEHSSCVVCRMTQSALLRLSSNPALFGEEALRLSEAWACYDALMDDPRIEYGMEPVGIEHRWRRLTASPSYSPKVWTDAYLVAFAVTGDLQLVTFDTSLGSMARENVSVLSV